ncbi:2,2-dialkylglycine decarboxylase [Paramyrothecium foliicola]|nr:2,2-dialkylglycine decarboxylase [Paramyrothecium foliicola]
MSLHSLKSLILQSFPPKPTFTENNVPDLTGKVCVVSGANSGVGKEVAQIFYSKNAKVYLAARSESKTSDAIESIKNAVPKTSGGQLIFLYLDLSDLDSVKKSAARFLEMESEIHLLFNNAGVGYPEQGSKTVQGYELQLGVNCVRPFLFTKLLTPTLTETAKRSVPNTVRVVWTSSSATEGISANCFMDNLDYRQEKSSFHKYCISKIGNHFHCKEFARRHETDGIISVALNPGNLDSDFWRTQGIFMSWLLKWTMLYPPKFGAYTTIFAAFSPSITLENTGAFVAPWGRFWQMSAEKASAAKRKSEGGKGTAKEFWECQSVPVNNMTPSKYVKGCGVSTATLQDEEYTSPLYQGLNHDELMEKSKKYVANYGLSIHPEIIVGAHGSYDWEKELDYGFKLIDLQSCGSLAACIVECVQSSGGVHILPSGYLKSLKNHCERRGMLLIVDEAQTGVGRCGDFMAFQRHGMVPDILTLSKTLGNGLALSAVVTSNEIDRVCAERDFFFATTHTNDPLPAAVGNKVLEVVFRDNIIGKARKAGEMLQKGLKKLQDRYGCIGDVRATGLMAGLEIVQDRQSKMPAVELADRIGQRAYELGVWVNLCSHPSFGGTLRILPPITVTDEGIKEGLEMLESAFKTTEGTMALY